MSLFLADSSVWVARRRPGVEALKRDFLERFRRGEIATCVPVALEVLAAAPDAEAYTSDWDTVWRALFWLPLSERAHQRALEVQRQVTELDGHRASPSAFLVAACAEEARESVVVWHCDPSLAVICEHTGQPHEPVLELARG
jgi:predicted nucleic acid-binding protein